MRLEDDTPKTLRLQEILFENRNVMMVIQTLPSRWAWDGRDIRMTISGANLLHLRGLVSDGLLRVTGARAVLEFGNALEALERLESISEAKRLGVTLPAKFDFKTEPRPYQLEAFALSRDLPYFGLFMDPGTGKTKVILDTAAYLWDKGDIQALVVLAPNGVHWNWAENEVPVHTPDWTFPTVFLGSSDRGKSQARRLEDTVRTPGLKIFCFSIDSMSSEGARNDVESVLKTLPSILVIDESTRIKSHTAQRTKWAYKIAEIAPFRRIMSGTPVVQGNQDLFSQLYFLSPDILGLRTFTEFKAQYCVTVMKKFGGFRQEELIVGYKNYDILSSRLDGCTYRARKSQLNLPPKIYQRAPYELSPAVRRIYDELVKQSVTEFEGNVLTEENAMVKLMRLQQVANGWFPNVTQNDDGDNVTTLQPIDSANARVQVLLDTIDMLGEDQSIIIWSVFRADLAAIANALPPGSFVEYHGGVSSEDRQEAIRLFQSKKRRFFLANQRAAGHGITLTAATVCIWYTNDYSLELRLQGEDRPHRIGQTETVLNIDIEARRTVNRKVTDALLRKEVISRTILNDPERFFLNYE